MREVCEPVCDREFQFSMLGGFLSGLLATTKYHNIFKHDLASQIFCKTKTYFETSGSLCSGIIKLLSKFFSWLVLYFHSSWDFFCYLEDLKQQGDEFSLEGKDRTKFLKEE